MRYGIIPGPGDEETWPPYSGHPNDPRSPEEFDDEEELDTGDFWLVFAREGDFDGLL